MDLKAGLDEQSDDIVAACSRVVASGWAILGPELEAFEEEFAAYCGARHCIGVGNGLDALALALRARGIGPGDEVLVPAQTFIATWLAVSMTGATPVPVDVELSTYAINPALIEAAITKRTRAVLPVHLYGQPADMTAIRQIAERYDLFVLEDAAQAHGAEVGGVRTGALGHAAAFSFYPTKNLGAIGDGGAIVTNDPQIAEAARRLRNYGSTHKYVHVEAGVNSRLDEMQAAILRVRLRQLDRDNARRRHLAAEYSRVLNGVDGFMLPACAVDSSHVYHLFVVRARRREELVQYLSQNDISTLIHYPIPPYRQQAYSELGIDPTLFPNSEKMAQETISLPMWPQMDLAVPTRVAEAIRAFAADQQRIV